MHRPIRVMVLSAVAMALPHAIARADLPILNESTKLTASDGLQSAAGMSSAIDGNIAVAGAGGAAYVYQKTGSVWSQVASLQAGDSAARSFGYDVSVSGSTLVVGAIDDQNSTATGSAYIFEQQPNGTWTQTAKLTASDPHPVDRFGYSVSVSGAYVIVGANRGDSGVPDTGAAYIFTKVSGVWTQVAKLTPPGAIKQTQFGASVAINGNTIVVGASEVAAHSLTNYGAAYVYERNVSTGIWSLSKSLELPYSGSGNGNEQFGEAVAISGNTIVAAAPGDTLGGGVVPGSVAIFERNLGGSNNWGSDGRFYRPADWPGGIFGGTTAFNGDVAVDGNNMVLGQFLYQRNAGAPGGWAAAGVFVPLDTTLAPDGTSSPTRYSDSVAISGGTFVSGAIFLDGIQPDTGGLLVVGVPEPATLALAAVCGLLFLPRRGKRRSV